MYKEIALRQADGDEKVYGFKAVASTAVRYQQVFREDLLSQMQKFQSESGSDGSVLDKLAFVMNAQAEEKDLSKLSFDSFVEWLDGIDSGQLLSHYDEFFDLYMGNRVSDSTLKKKAGQRNGK